MTDRKKGGTACNMTSEDYRLARKMGMTFEEASREMERASDAHAEYYSTTSRQRREQDDDHMTVYPRRDFMLD